MDAPDKIYLNIPKALYEKDQEIVATWDTKEWDDCINPEYIRKDLLLEWAKELTSEPYDRTTESAHKHQIANYLREKYNSL